MQTSKTQVEADQRINERIFETSLDLILVVDRRGDFMRVSPSSKRILGYDPHEMVGRSARFFLYPDDLERTRQEMRLARREQESRNFDCRYVHKEGHVVPISWLGVWSESESQYFFIGRDLTKRLQMEEQQRRSQRLEAVGQLTGGIAHDFNNLLSVIIGNLELVQQEIDSNHQIASRLRKVEKAALRGAELTAQLLAFARQQPMQSRVFDMNECVAGTMSLLQRTLGEAVLIESRLATDLRRTYADPTLFESALVNLAINSRDAMPGGGNLVVETSNARIDSEVVSDGIDIPPGHYCVLSVSDTGTGMEPATVARAFEPFFTTKAPGEGTGMGLSMVYGFATQSNGGVKIYSEPGLGTTIRLYLPCATSDSDSETVASIEPGRARAGECILVAEDNPDVRDVVVAQLLLYGYRILEAQDGETVLDLIRTGERIDLLFTDVMMPGGIGGIELAQAARELSPELKILLTSGFALATIGMKGGQGSRFPLLTKPYLKSDLAAKVREVLDA